MFAKSHVIFAKLKVEFAESRVIFAESRTGFAEFRVEFADLYSRMDDMDMMDAMETPLQGRPVARHERGQ